MMPNVDDSSPSGIALDPAGGSDLWTVDRASRTVFHYADARTVRSGVLSAVDTYALAPTNLAPEGIADPPPHGFAVSVSAELV